MQRLFQYSLASKKNNIGRTKRFFNSISIAALCAIASFSIAGSAHAKLQFGANGHIGVYPLATLTHQLDLLKDLDVKSYRVDVYDTDTGGMNALASAISQAKARGIGVLPVLIVKPLAGDTESALYQRAFTLAKGVAQRFSGDVKVWELGNEYDIYALLRACETRDDGRVFKCEWGAPSGADVLDYNAKRFDQVKAIVRGLGDGVRAVDPNARRIVNAAGWFHYGFLKRLMNDAVGFEITGYHWYSEQGDIENAGGTTNILQALASFGKPIWMTEFGRRHGSFGNGGLDDQAAYMEKTMAQYKRVATKYNIEMAHVYELFDQPWANAVYGLVGMSKNTSGAWQVAAKKPAYESFKRLASATLPAQPDLIVTHVSAPTSAAVNAPVVFAATIRNQGTAATNKLVGIGFYVDGKAVNWGSTSVVLGPGESATISAGSGPQGRNYWNAVQGSHRVTAWVDDVNRMVELGESNNKKDAMVQVQ